MKITAELSAGLAGRYVVEREIGRGGMAVVYLARDTKHDRLVAVKVLNPELTAALGPERFLAEIRTTATLQHPNLLPLFDSGEVGGLLYYVMPYVEGESLRARLEREQQLPVEDAVRIATGVANALSYAHARGVIHRDLKPENVLLQHGQPVVLDFGIALALRNAAEGRKTQTGISVGTPQYMSPEQAAGEKTIDARADIYALGTLTYEMLAGEPPHTGRSAQAVIAKVMAGEVRPVTALRPSVPAHVASAVQRALSRVPADRFSSAAEFARALEAHTGNTPVPELAAPASARRRVRETGAWATTAVALGVAAWVAVRAAGSSAGTAGADVIRAMLVAPAGMMPDIDAIGGVAITRDGDRLAYVLHGSAADRIVVRRRSEAAGRDVVVPRPRDLAFSPDGRWLAYFSDGNVYKVSVEGGAPVLLARDLPRVLRGMTWASGDTVIASLGASFIALPATGSATPRRIATPFRWPVALQNGVVLGSRSEELVALKPGTNDVVDLGIHGLVPLGVLDGHLLYHANDALMAVPFDAERLRATGVPFSVIDSIRIDDTIGAFSALSASGTLIYNRGLRDNQIVLASASTAAPRALRADGPFSHPRFSPDGRRIAFEKPWDIYAMNLVDGAVARLTTDGRLNYAPEWTVDGKRLVGIADTGRTVWSIASDGTGTKDSLLKRGQMRVSEVVPTPDGRSVLLRTGGGDIYMAPLNDLSAMRPLISGPAREAMPSVSPDGRWLAYMSDQGGRYDVYVTSFPVPAARIQVSEEGGLEPLWARSSDVLYYRAGNQIIAAKLRAGQDLSIESRTVALTGEIELDPGTSHQNYDVAPDGKSFLVLRPVNRGLPPIIAYNWEREFRATIAARARNTP